jgi:hypothetical protein
VDAFLERKERAVMADLSTAFSGYERLVRQVNLIRAWTVALMGASMGWIAVGRGPDPASVGLPAGVALLAFLVLELRERSSMRFNKAEVLALERMLMTDDQAQFEEELRAYEFRDLRLNRLPRLVKLRHLVRSVISPQVVFWYGFWVVMLTVGILYLREASPRPGG